MALDGKHSITQICKMMRVSQSALSRWKRQFLAEQQGVTPKAPAISAEQIDCTTSYRWETAKPDWTLATLQEALLQAFEQSEETYGSRRLSLAVTRLGLKSGRFKTRCLMREMQLKAKCPKAKIWRKQAVVFVENI